MVWYLHFLPQVKKVLDQEGFGRQKRGYRSIDEIYIKMTDPLFSKQWYLVSSHHSISASIMLSYPLITDPRHIHCCSSYGDDVFSLGQSILSMPSHLPIHVSPLPQCLPWTGKCDFPVFWGQCAFIYSTCQIKRSPVGSQQSTISVTFAFPPPSHPPHLISSSLFLPLIFLRVE